jgi:hypothetical protein
MGDVPSVDKNDEPVGDIVSIEGFLPEIRTVAVRELKKEFHDGIGAFCRGFFFPGEIPDGGEKQNFYHGNIISENRLFFQSAKKPLPGFRGGAFGSRSYFSPSSWSFASVVTPVSSHPRAL